MGDRDNFLFAVENYPTKKNIDDSLFVAFENEFFTNAFKKTDNDQDYFFYIEIFPDVYTLNIYNQDDVIAFNNELYDTLEGDFAKNLVNLKIEQIQKLFHMMEQDIRREGCFVLKTNKERYFLKIEYNAVVTGDLKLAVMSVFSRPKDYKQYADAMYVYTQNNDAEGMEKYFEVYKNSRLSLNPLKLRTSFEQKEYLTDSLEKLMINYFIKIQGNEGSNVQEETQSFLINSGKTMIYDTSVISLSEDLIRDNALFDTMNDKSTDAFRIISINDIQSQSYVLKNLYVVNNEFPCVEIFPQNDSRTFRPMTRQDYVKLNRIIYKSYFKDDKPDFSSIPQNLTYDILRAAELRQNSFEKQPILFKTSEDGRYFLNFVLAYESKQKLSKCISYINACYTVQDDYSTKFPGLTLTDDELLANAIQTRQKMRVIKLKADLIIKTNLSSGEKRDFQELSLFASNKNLIYDSSSEQSSSTTSAFTTKSSGTSVKFTNPFIKTFESFLAIRPKSRKQKKNFGAEFDAIVVNDEDFLTTEQTTVNLPKKFITEIIESLEPITPTPTPTPTPVVVEPTQTTTDETPIQIQTTTTTSGSSGGVFGFIIFLLIIIIMLYIFSMKKRRIVVPRRFSRR